MKKGFTMIELIFVIVILGILAAIAVPKLTSVKDDAEAAKAVSNLGTFVNELTVYYTTHDSNFPAITTAANEKPKDLTNVAEITILTPGKAATGSTAATAATYQFKAGSDKDCIKIEPSGDIITLTPKVTGSNGCKIAIVAAVKAGILHGTVDASGKVTAVGGKKASDGTTDVPNKGTEISVSGGTSGLYDISGLSSTGS